MGKAKALGPAQEPVPAKPEVPHDRVVDFDTMLRYKLGDEELLAYAREMGDCNAEIATLEQNMKSVAKEFASKIACKEARRATLGQAITTGAEMRTVKCSRTYSYALSTVVETRRDGQDPYVVSARPMTEAELQRELDLGI